jgi:glycosyltransferase involved in cell wall biosynthesis
MKIAFLAWRDLANPLAGGSEVLVDHLASGLASLGHDVTLYCGGPVAARDYRVVDLGGTYDQYLRAPFSFALHRERPDVVVDVCNGIPFFAGVWQTSPTVCLVNHVHTDQWDLWFRPLLAGVGRVLERKGVPAAYRHNLFVAVSPSTSESLQALGVSADRIRLVPNGVDVPASGADRSATPLFVAASRLVPHKRLDILLDVWPRVRATTGGRLVIIGEGPERANLARRLTDGASLVGFISEEEKQRLLSESWLLLHPSQLEGWGLVIMEAAAHGTPSMGFDVNGVRDSIVDGETGVLVPHTEDLADAWIDLCDDEARRTRLGEAARRRAVDFSWRSTVTKFESVLDEARFAGPAKVRVTTAARRPVMASPPPLVGLGHGGRPPLSLVVPAYNEEGRIETSLPLIADRAVALGAELLVIDDGSEDRTHSLASEILQDVPRARVIGLSRHRGKGAAVRAGVEASTGETIAYMDADLATDLDDLSKLVRRLSEVHVAVGSRAVEGSVTSGGSLSRVVMGRNFNRLARGVTGMEIQDFQCGLKAFRAPAAKLLFGLARTEGFAFDVEILWLANRIGYRLAEMPVTWEAVSGSHVRPIRDSASMGADVLQLPLRWSHRRILTALEARMPHGGDPEDVVAALHPFMSSAGPVVPWKTGALALLPFVQARAAEQMVSRLRDELPALDLSVSSLHSRAVLGPRGQGLRGKLAAG